VTHDELLDAVWPNTHIQPQAIKSSFSISEARWATGRIGPSLSRLCIAGGTGFIAAVSEGTAHLPAVSAPT
jgi:hypothetical protein